MIPGLENYPVSAAMLYTAAGAIAVSVLITEWLKKYLGDWRFTNLLCLGIILVAEVGAAWVSQGKMDAQIAFAAVLLGFLGASVATFGYEVVVNLLGKAGVGPRSEQRIVAEAEATLADRGFKVELPK